MPRPRVPALAGRVRASVERRPPQVPAEGGHAPGGARPFASRDGTRDQADDAVSTRRQHLGRSDRRRLPRRPLRPARRSRYEGEDYYVQYLPVGMQELVCPPELMLAQMTCRRRRPLHPAGRRRLRRDERLQRVRAAAVPRQIHGPAARRRGDRRSRRHAGRSRSRGRRRSGCAASTTRRTSRATATRATSITRISGRSGTRSSLRGCRCSSSCRRRRPTTAPATSRTWPRSTRC